MTTSAITILGRAALTNLSPAQRPLVVPDDLRERIVHFGLGAFHRAHQAVYTEAAAAGSGQPWGIAGVAPGSAATVQALHRQDCLYTVTDLAPGAAHTRVVGAMTTALQLGPDAASVRDLLTSPEVSVVTLTITEKGYHRRPDGSLETTAPQIAADLGTANVDENLGSVIGMLAGSLTARYRAGGAPITIVSCDNMAGNGAATSQVIREFLQAASWPDSDAVLDWLNTAVGFPATVVDRIVPSTTTDDIDTVSARLGVRDAVPVLGEPYRQWVLQDAFTAPRPPWELAGARFVDDVTPYQLMKLRLLNGSHSAMAYLGLAAGCHTVADVMNSDWGEKLVRGLTTEVAPTLGSLTTEQPAYTDELVRRFRNPAMRDQLRRIGCDGSLKIPERLLGALRTLTAAGSSAPILELALAGWITATRPGDAGEQIHGTTDPAAGTLAAAWRTSTTPRQVTAALLRAVGANDLAETHHLVAGIADRLPNVRAGRIDL